MAPKRRRTEARTAEAEAKNAAPEAEETGIPASHTILLMQTDNRASSRTFYDYDRPSEMAFDVVKKFERRLQQLNPNMKDFTYDIQDLFDYVDSLADLSALVFNRDTQMYAPYGRDWIKRKVFMNLKRQSKQTGAPAATAK